MTPVVFYLNASGGTGKTYTLNLLIDHALASGLKVVSVATTGIAAIHLKNGE